MILILEGFRTRAARAGLTRIEVLFIILGVGVLGLVAWLGIMAAGEPRRIWQCKSRLQSMGKGFSQYAKDHGGELPPGAVEDPDDPASWDVEVVPYVVPGLTKTQDTNALAAIWQKAARYFHCPSDKEPRGGAQPRSYAMPMFDLKRAGWPPGPDSEGGLGLHLTKEGIGIARKAVDGDADYFPAIKLADAHDPQNTALVVERIAIRNALWSPTFACILNTDEQFAAKTFERKDFHRRQFNYLLLDGHVELMSPKQSMGLAGSGGVWTMNPGD